MRTWWKHILKTVLATVVTLLLAEGIVRGFLDPDARPVLWQVEVIKSHRHFSKDVDRATPWHYEFDGVVVGEQELRITDSRGTLQTYPFAKPPGTFRVVAVGDSITEQWQDTGHQNYTDYLKTLLQEARPGQAIEVLPIGVGGYNTLKERSFFQAKLSALEFDLLLVQVTANDFDHYLLVPSAAEEIPKPDDFFCPGLAPGEPLALPVGSLKKGEHRWPGVRILGLNCALPSYEKHQVLGMSSKLWWSLGRLVNASKDPTWGTVPVETNPNLREGLRWFRDHAGLRGSPLLVLVFPQNQEGPGDSRERALVSILEEEKIPHLWLRPALAAHEPMAELFIDDCHPTEAGHEIVARAILDHLRLRSVLAPATPVP